MKTVKLWIRTCQECWHNDIYKHPDMYLKDSWRDVKCHKCKSPALDYGSYRDCIDEKTSKV